MSNVTRIKICGITNEVDAYAAIACGADALGFIFVPNTPRYIGDRLDLISVVASLPPFITRVGVCVHPGQIPQEWAGCLDMLQVYEYSAEVRQNARKDLLPAFRIREVASLEAVTVALESADREARRPRAILLDAYHEKALGGGGVSFDWDLASAAKLRFDLPILLAGGLRPENVAEAVATVHPYAVDVSSGVEAGPGRKDHARLQAFCHAVRNA